MTKTPYGEKLEPLARYLRFADALKNVPKNRSIDLVDLGCGPKIPFYNFAIKHGISFHSYIAIDPLIMTEIKIDEGVVKTLKQFVLKEIPLPENSVDCIFSSAFIEHIDYPKEILNECLRILRKDGIAIFTTPSKRAKGLLEFLAFKLNLISQQGVLEHKQYFTPESLKDLLKDSSYQHTLSHHSFEFGLNNLFIVKKL